MKITVITVCLNSKKTIEKAIKSVIGQARQGWDLEYIVVDGGSTDGTVSVLKKYEPYIDRYVSELDKGIFDAMNKGIDMASGDIIAFLNSDDWYETDALNSIMDAFEVGYCDCICCDNYVLGEDGQKEYFDASGKEVEDLHVQMIYYHSSIFCRKEFFRKNGNFDLRYKIAADYDWFLGIVEKGARLGYIHKPVFTFCYGGISSVNQIDCARETRQIALRHLPANDGACRERIDRRLCEVVLYAVDQRSLYPKLIELLGINQPNILWGAGARGIWWAEWLKKAGIRIEAIVDNNRLLWGSFIEQIPVCSPEILDGKNCNLIITPEKYVMEIKNELSRITNDNMRVLELNILCKILAESAVEGLLA
ncbi:MAG: glycosyltransferase [Lachnospiraceae bacterium]|nr:glycosyltransferase [Lachnospiraceae bacterium]